MDTRFLVERLSLRSSVIPLAVTRRTMVAGDLCFLCPIGRATGPAVATDLATLAGWTVTPPSSTLAPVMWATALAVWVAVEAFRRCMVVVHEAGET
ncbi:hypothetical protein ACH5RR_018462 [Cinchona calisaya]|uniref:Uncharacterized protein n=1 Tax=Cinchona calisaya TaxID=153742 RepID=A0ABD2ZMS9_9GENT